MGASPKNNIKEWQQNPESDTCEGIEHNVCCYPIKASNDRPEAVNIRGRNSFEDYIRRLKEDEQHCQCRR